MIDKGSAAELRELEALIAIAREHDLDAMLVEDGDYRVEIVRRESHPQRTEPAPLTPELIAPTTTRPSDTSHNAAPSNPTPAGEHVTAPIVGVFYRSPSPTAPPFVKVGDRVSVGQPLCILEAMKLMNEITSEVAGVITAIHPQNGDLVTIGQLMFQIAP